MKRLSTLFLLLLTCNGFLLAQAPAGSAFFVDYNQFQNDNLRRYLSCGNDASLNPGTSLTMEAWVRIHDSNWNQKILGKLNPSFNSGYMLAVDQGKCYPEIWTPGLHDDLSGFIPPLGYWYHFAVSVTAGDSMITYVNGEMVGGVPVGGNAIASNNDNLIIGIAPWDLQNFQYFGHVDEVRIWSVARTQQEIVDHMFIHLAGNETGLQAYYDFNNAVAPTSAPDVTSNGNDCSFVNCDASNITDSDAVLGDADMENQTDLHGLWNGNGFTNPRVSLTDNGLSLVDTLTDWDYVVFGHDAGTDVSTMDLPAGAPAGMERTGRIWYLNERGSTSPNFSMDLTNAAGGGATLNTTYMASQYFLLFRSGTTGAFSVVKTADTKSGNTLIFQNVDLEDGYYTLAASATALSVDGRQDFYLNLFPNPATQSLNFQVDLELAGAAEVKIINLLGEEVYHVGYDNISRQVQSLDLSDLAAGTYIFQLQAGNEFLAKRFQISRN